MFMQFDWFKNQDCHPLQCDIISYPLFVHAIRENINLLGSYHTGRRPSVIRTQKINIFRIAWEQTGGNEFITQ